MRSPTGSTTKSPRAVTVTVPAVHTACQWHCAASVCQCASGLSGGSDAASRLVCGGTKRICWPIKLYAAVHAPSFSVGHRGDKLLLVIRVNLVGDSTVPNVVFASYRWCSRSRLAESAPRSEDRSAVPGSAVTSARAPACWPSLAQNDCASCSESMRTPSTNASSEEPIEVGMGKQHSAISRRSPDISAKRRHQDIGLKRCCLCKYVDHIAPLPWNSPLLSRSCRASCGISRRHPGCSRSGRR